ncbi:amino-acid N-acetyltransferase [Aestuariirhabdus litorea]|uniref:Amino-acid acetyltransferase n=1 Tax=Aestuariirhabdus litorea TaxID=2528527 RepID=A0A3P3VM16_9GAMM|nr:amino-acid N-acetyltransferase [Aestuariirhabdus litorea]RWW93637.1 amino-acid N-acetyltransferase [Endozoicomonadaceae bacterium GTF-13]
MSSAEYVNFFRHSSPYINAHRGRTFVIHLGGATLADEGFSTIVHDIALLNSLGVRLVLVFGARPQIEQRVVERGINCRFHHGVRLTSKEVLESVKDAVGSLRIRIESMLSMGLANSPMHGARIRVVSGNFVTAKPLGVVDGIDFQQTGEVRRIDREAITQLLNDGYVVLLSCLGSSPTGEVFNLPVEQVATATAAALKAEKLILFGAGNGICNAEGELLRQMRVQQARTLLPALEDEPKQLLEASINACAQGVNRCHIIGHGTDGALLQELFTRDGAGTLVTQQGYEETRQATIEDVGGILELIQPLEEQGVLVRRSRKQLEQEIDLFTVIERDGMIIGCASLHPFTDVRCAELACVAIHPDYRQGSRGDLLLEYAEEFARRQGIERLFVLTTRTAHWFVERGFGEIPVEQLPEAKKQIYNLQRNSKVFEKQL